VSIGIRSAALGLIAGAIIGLIFSHALHAHVDDQNSGIHWLRKCTSPEANGQIECAIYLRAMVEYDELRAKALEQKRFICPQKGVTVGQSREVVLQYMRARPDDLQQPFVLLAHLGLAAAFPCSGDAGPSAGATPAAPR
jgi:hypothetical protein